MHGSYAFKQRFLCVEILRVRFFNKIQDWIFDPRSCGFVTIKEKKNPKRDFLS